MGHEQGRSISPGLAQRVTDNRTRDRKRDVLAEEEEDHWRWRKDLLSHIGGDGSSECGQWAWTRTTQVDAT